MLLSDIFFTWEREIFSLNNGSVNVLSPVLTHFLFILHPQEFSNKFWVDDNDLNQFVPQLEDLRSHLVDVRVQVTRNLERVLGCDPLGECLWLTPGDGFERPFVVDVPSFVDEPL